nr:MAG TPA: hypothetical protein [Caudoviricetes sp.]
MLSARLRWLSTMRGLLLRILLLRAHNNFL